MFEKILKKYSLDEWRVINNLSNKWIDIKKPEHLKIYFDKKKGAGHIVEFEESNFEKRNKIPDSVKSILVIAFPYLTERDLNLNFNSPYKISKYALRKDYHIVLKSILFEISQCLIESYYAKIAKPFFDSRIFFEKDIAKLAGLGFYGKNGLIYTKNYGSYIFIGGIMTDILLELKEEEEENLCKNCNLCIRSCPNKCYSDSIFKAGDCISYLTQTKKNIDFFSIYDNLWGCDICQDVCPLNKKDYLCFSNIADFKLREELFIPLELIAYGNVNYIKTCFKDTPIGWSGINVLIRNAKKIIER